MGVLLRHPRQQRGSLPRQQFLPRRLHELETLVKRQAVRRGDGNGPLAAGVVADNKGKRGCLRGLHEALSALQLLGGVSGAQQGCEGGAGPLLLLFLLSNCHTITFQEGLIMRTRIVGTMLLLVAVVAAVVGVAFTNSSVGAYPPPPQLEIERVDCSQGCWRAVYVLTRIAAPGDTHVFAQLRDENRNIVEGHDVRFVWNNNLTVGYPTAADNWTDIPLAGSDCTPSDQPPQLVVHAGTNSDRIHADTLPNCTQYSFEVVWYWTEPTVYAPMMMLGEGGVSPRAVDVTVHPARPATFVEGNIP